MKKIILLFSLALSALSAQAQTTGTWNKVNARDTFGLSGRQLAEIVYSITAASRNNESPTAKAVYDYIQSLGVIQPTYNLVYGTGTGLGSENWFQVDPTDNNIKIGAITADSGIVNITQPSGFGIGNAAIYARDVANLLKYKRGVMPAWYIQQKAVDNGDGTTNNVLEIIYNTFAGGNEETAADANFGISMEPHWIAADGDTVSEWHIFFNDQKGGVHRPLTGFFNYHKPEENSWGFAVDKSYFNGNLGNKRAKVAINMTNASLGAYPLEVYKHKNTLTNTNTTFTRSELDSVTAVVVGNYNTGGESPVSGLSTMIRWSNTQDRLAQFYLGLQDMTGAGFDAGSDFVAYYQNSGVFAEAFRVKDANGYFGIKLSGGNQPTQHLHVNGNARVTGAFYDSNNDPGSSGQVLSSTVTGTDWVTGGTVGGSGASPQIAHWNTSSTLTGSSAFLYESSILKVKNTNSATSFLTADAQENIRLQNTDATNNNWSSITNYTSSGLANSAIAFQNVNQSNRESAIDIWGHSGSGFLRLARFKHDGITLDRATTLASTSLHTGAATFSGGITANTVASNFNSQVNVGSASAGNIAYFWNDYASTSAAGSNAFAAVVLKNRNATSNNWTALQWDSQTGQIAGSIAMQYLDHTSDYGDFAIHTRGSGTGFAEAFRITSEKRVGIGTSAPQNRLDVEGAAVIGAAYSGTNTAPTNGLLVEGNVGIGDNNPSTRLHVTTQTGTTTPILRIENTGGDADFFVINTAPEGAVTGSPGDIALRTDTGNGKLYVKGSGTGNTGWIELGSGGATDHGALTGLSDDDHAQYLLLAGRATGQIATGGTASGDDLTLRSTTDATKGDIILNDQGGNVILGGGELSGELRFMEPGGSGSNYTGFKSGALGANQMYTLPTDAPADDEVLTWNTGGTLSWETVGGSSNYQTWKEDGAAATVQPNANFVTSSTIEPTLTNDAGNSETEVSLEIVAASVNSTHLNQMGATESQVLTWNGANWAAAYVTDDIYPADITVDVNDYEPTGWATSTEVFVSSTAIWTITGFEALVGQARTIINDGDLPFVIACHHTGSTVTNRVFGREDLIVLPGDAVTLTYNNNIGRWYVKSNTFYPQKLGTVWNGIYYYQQPGSTNQSDHSFLGLAVSGTGTGNANEVPAAEQANHWDVSTGSTAAGVATVYLPKNANNFARTGDGHIEVQANVFVPTLSTSAQRYTLQVGMIPNANTTTLAVNNSVFVRYKDDVNDGEFELVTRNNAGTETAVDCNVAVAANTPYQITVVLNEARTEARAYINGALAAINTSTMPNADVSVGARVGIFKSVGTTARFAKIGSIVGFVVL